MAVNEFATGGIIVCIPHLVEEQVPQAVMDEGIVIEFHRLRQMRLAALDDIRPGIRHQAEIMDLSCERLRLIGFVILEGADHDITLIV